MAPPIWTRASIGRRPRRNHFFVEQLSACVEQRVGPGSRHVERGPEGVFVAGASDERAGDVSGQPSPRRSGAPRPGFERPYPFVREVVPSEAHGRLGGVESGQEREGRVLRTMARLGQAHEAVQCFLGTLVKQRRHAAVLGGRAQRADALREGGFQASGGGLGDGALVTPRGGEPAQAGAAVGGDVVGAHVPGQPQPLHGRGLRFRPAAGDVVEHRGLGQGDGESGRIVAPPQVRYPAAQHVPIGPSIPHASPRGPAAAAADRRPGPYVGFVGRAHGCRRCVGGPVAAPPGRRAG
ncbi:hypothetical protein SGRI78S_03046 [Streptomyces griseus subsp. griseus]